MMNLAISCILSLTWQTDGNFDRVEIEIAIRKPEQLVNQSEDSICLSSIRCDKIPNFKGSAINGLIGDLMVLAVRCGLTVEQIEPIFDSRKNPAVELLLDGGSATLLFPQYGVNLICPVPRAVRNFKFNPAPNRIAGCIGP